MSVVLIFYTIYELRFCNLFDWGVLKNNSVPGLQPELDLLHKR